MQRRFFLRFSSCGLLAFLLFLSFTSIACNDHPCYRYFQELKRRCRLNSTTEGAKLDEFLIQPFSECQREVCLRSSLSEIICNDPESHVPGGINGRFYTCDDPDFTP